jgi:hypothetical protein
VTQPLTLLQRGVIQRLREAGQSVIAEEAHAHWTVGMRVDGDAAWDIRSEELRRDFEKANAQARTNE